MYSQQKDEIKKAQKLVAEIWDNLQFEIQKEGEPTNEIRELINGDIELLKMMLINLTRLLNDFDDREE